MKFLPLADSRAYPGHVDPKLGRRNVTRIEFVCGILAVIVSEL